MRHARHAHTRAGDATVAGHELDVAVVVGALLAAVDGRLNDLVGVLLLALAALGRAAANLLPLANTVAGLCKGFSKGATGSIHEISARTFANKEHA